MPSPTPEIKCFKTPPLSSVRVIKQRVSGETVFPPEEDTLAIEDPLQILLILKREGQSIEKPLMVTMRTPGLDEALIHGLLYSEGIIQCREDITRIELSTGNPHAAPTHARVHLRSGLDTSAASIERNFSVHSSCGVCGTVDIGKLSIPTSLRIDNECTFNSDLLHTLAAKMYAQQSTFQSTGGLHAAALYSVDGDLKLIAEDIGRHNSLDKVIGSRLMSDQTANDYPILCVSGRMSYEILQKAIIARIPIIAGVGAPSSLAVALANDFNITLIGFLRNHSYSIYSCPERIHHPNQQ
jgi:FdhD protein